MSESIDFSEIMKDGGSAFPSVQEHPNGGKVQFQGITVRDVFAAQAITGTADGFLLEGPIVDYATSRAKLAYEIADAMLKERSK